MYDPRGNVSREGGYSNKEENKNDKEGESRRNKAEGSRKDK